jgi:hypothetical protein
MRVQGKEGRLRCVFCLEGYACFSAFVGALGLIVSCECCITSALFWARDLLAARLVFLIQPDAGSACVAVLVHAYPRVHYSAEQQVQPSAVGISSCTCCH